MTPTILLTGMFDLDNYGDLLFPLIAKRRLEARGFRIVAVAPSANRASLADAPTPISLPEMMAGEDPIAGIVVGGGYIIHASSLDFLHHYKGSAAGGWSGVGLWLGATLAAALRGVPIAWNAPGVPHPFSARQQALVAAALRAASYVAVRDRGSVRLLAPPADVSPDVVPDPVVELPLLWPRETLAAAYRELLQRKGLAGETRLLALHVRDRSVAGMDLATLSAVLEQFAALHGLVPMLVAVGESHGDPALACRLSTLLGSPHLLLDDPLSLREITAALAHSVMYVGASLHGYVASIAYGVPSILIARPAYQKFAGFLEHTGRPQDLAHDWTAALHLAGARVGEPRGNTIPPAVFEALDQHYAAIAAAMHAPWQRSAERADFALALLRSGIRSDGPAWAMQPAVTRRMRSGGATAC